MPDTVIDYQDTAVEVHRVVVGPVDNNVYVVRCRETGDSMLIDAANEHEQLLELCTDLDVRQVVETHGHWDHIQAVEAVRDAGIDVAVTSGRRGHAPLLRPDPGGRLGARGRAAARSPPSPPPGTPRDRCASPSRARPLLFSGDTLFPGGPGNTSFEHADFATIIRSIEGRLFAAFGADTIVLPGHGAGTTIGTESPHLDEWIDRGW